MQNQLLNNAAEVYTYDPFFKTADLATNDMLRWPERFIVGSLHRKHVLQPRRGVQLQKVTQSVASWEHRLRWRLFFAIEESTGDGNRAEWRHLRVRRQVPRPCTMAFDGDTERFFDDVRRSVFSTVQKARFRERPCYTRRPAIIQLGLERMAASEYTALPTDKSGGFAIVKDIALRLGFLQCLAKSEYLETPWFHNSDIGVVMQYTAAAKDLAEEYGDPELWKALCSNLSSGEVRAKVSGTVKVHKPQGEVTMRILHGCPNSSFLPGMNFVSSTLRSGLDGLPHLLRDTEHF